MKASNYLSDEYLAHATARFQVITFLKEKRLLAHLFSL
jgi:hypothetical protein